MNTIQIKNLIQHTQQVIDTLEVHIITKPQETSEHAVKEAFKSLYIIKNFFEGTLDREDLSEATE